MANGDIAAAAGIPVVPATGKVKMGYDEINRALDLIVTEDNKVKAAVTAIAKGGTGATAAAAAAVNLNVPAWTDVAPKGNVISGQIARFSDNGRLQVVPPATDYDVATKGYVDSAVSQGSGLADGPTAAAYNRGTTGSSYFAVWMNAQLQFMRNTSARRFKKRIRAWKPAAGSIMQIRTVIFDRKGGDPNEVGFIAEEILDAGLGDAVVYFDGKIDGINDRVILAALLSHVQDLTRRLQALE